ncbi:YbdD/YjiX family protein [Streptomyces sp. WMMB303]|uniref:YbdD/YjiX family protein n=1 Tax=Streptomyces sp. WMMB303 TaxID=3034154 RepID=UPI0023EB715F|nr:YbdD/YjiX family protein [Streptomyces sp. WMMB303]MDF4253513.1 YbdD/YjiX family protein [Streptomyces sp. WMMB303]
MSAAGADRVVRPVLRAGRWVRWYVRELTDESAYDRYVAHVRRHQGPDAEVPSRKEFERRRTDARESDPREGFRCC